MKDKFQKGQVALVVLLIMAGVLTLGMATSKKVVVDTKLDKEEEMLKQAFNAAESGIETFLGSGKNEYSAIDNGSKANVNVTALEGGSVLTSGGTVEANSAYIFWLVPHSVTTGDLEWGSAYNGGLVNVCTDTSFTRSLKVSYFYKILAGGYNVDRFVYNLSNTGDRVNNAEEVTPSASASCPSGMRLSGVEIDLHNTSGDVAGLVAVTPLFGATSIALIGDGELPGQGDQITSVGTAGEVNQRAGASRTVSVWRTYGGSSNILQYLLEGLEAGGGISNQ